jgi:5-bromo-4-chloroindolyl phosphate hydrolysis protein
VNRYRDIAAGAAGAAGFVAFYLALGLALPVSLGLAAGTAAAAWFTLSGVSFRGIQIANTPEASAEEVQQMLEAGERRAQEIAQAAKSISDPAFVAGVGQVLVTVRNIFEYLAKNPGRVKRARKFLSYYLDTTLFIVKSYCDLQASNDPDITASRTKLLDVLGTIKAAFEKQLAVLLRNDVLDIDAEIEVLRSSLKTEGLIPDEK